MGWWDDINQAIADTGILQTINPIARDVLPGVGLIEDVLGINPDDWPVSGQGAGHISAPDSLPGARLATGGVGGGASLDWSQMGVPSGLSLTATGRRGLIPFTGGVIPSGYRVAQRPARSGTPGRPAGVYLVPRRSMNPLNPRALMRAERRLSAFSHWVKRHFQIAKAAPRRRKGGFKKRRR